MGVEHLKDDQQQEANASPRVEEAKGGNSASGDRIWGESGGHHSTEAVVLGR